MTINQSRINRLEAKLAPRDDLLRSPIIVLVDKYPRDDEQTTKARIREAVGSNPLGRHVVAIVLERDEPAIAL